MRFSQWMQAHRRSLLFLLALFVVAGALTSLRLPVTLFPKVDFPRVVVSLDAGDRPADMMMVGVTQPVEEAVRLVPGIRNVRSNTSRGGAEISVSFDWDADMSLATVQLNQAVGQLLPSLPAGTKFSTRRMDPTVFPMLAYSLTSAGHSQTELYDIAHDELRPLLSAINGVARVDVMGGAHQEYQVNLEPARLAAFGLTYADVTQAISESHVVNAVGRLEDHYKLYLVVTDTRLNDLAQLQNVVIKADKSGTITLADVATVIDGVQPQWTRISADGKQAVLLLIYQQSGGNSVQIAKDVSLRLGAHAEHLPKDIKLANWYDQSELVTQSASSVRDAIIIGTFLAAAVLFVFLRNGRMTLIATLIVPTVLATTVVLLYVMGMGFNIMTLGGMAAAVGLIIDDAIVMIEHIVRRLSEAGDRADGVPARSGIVMRASYEFLRPLAGSSASTIVIFVPLAFLSGVTGAFFKALSLTMATGLAISFLVTWLAIPILAERFLRNLVHAAPKGGRWTLTINQRYQQLMQRTQTRPVWMLLLVIPVLALGALGYARVGSGFMPEMDEGGFVLDYRAAPGTSLSETDRLVKQVEKIIKSDPSVDTYSRRTGAQLGGGLTEANEGDMFIRLKSGDRPDSKAVMDGIRKRIEAEVPGLNVELAQLMEDEIGDLTSVPQPIEIKLFSDNAIELEETAKRVAAAIAKVPGVVDTRDGINRAGDALEVHVERDKAALEGMSAEAVSQMLEEQLAGTVATQVQRGVKMVGIRVSLPKSQRSVVSDLQKLLLRAPDGHLFPLERIATIDAVAGQAQISRENLKRMVAVTGRISGRALGATIADIQRTLHQTNMLPKSMYFELGGLYQQQQIAFQGLLAVFAAAVGLVFLLLLFMYESFRIALAIMLAPLLAVLMVFFGMWITDTELNISAMMGMTMIVGIVTEVAIFYFSEFRELEARMSLDLAIIEAGKNRMRPIAMTTLATILTLLPLALAIGAGSGMQQSLAIAIISGLIVQLPLVLVVMPNFYRMLVSRKRNT